MTFPCMILFRPRNSDSEPLTFEEIMKNTDDLATESLIASLPLSHPRRCLDDSMIIRKKGRKFTRKPDKSTWRPKLAVVAKTTTAKVLKENRGATNKKKKKTRCNDCLGR